MKIIFFCFIILAITSCSENSPQNPISSSTPFFVNEYIKSDPQLKLFNEAIEITGLEQLFNSNQQKTFIIPTDRAINSYLNLNNYNSIEEIPIVELIEIVSYPIISDSIFSYLMNDGYYNSNLLASNNISYNIIIESSPNINDSKIINNSQIAVSDIRCTNGVVHTVNTVLVPPTIYDIISYDDNLRRTKNLIDVVDPSFVTKIQNDEKYTFLATNNEAILSHLNTFEFDQISERVNNILNYNLIKGEILALEFEEENDTELNQKLIANTDNDILKIYNPYNSGTESDSARLQLGNIATKNGVIHIVNQLIEYKN